MVFGWRKKKEEKNPEEVSIQKKVSLQEIPKIVDDIIRLRTTQTLAEIKSLRDKTEPLIKELIKIGQTLEKDNLDVDDIDKHLGIIVIRGKKQVIDVIKKDVSNLPHVSTFEDAENLNSILNQTLKKIGDVLGRQTRVIHIFAKKYAEKLKEILSQTNSYHSEIQQLIKNYYDTKITSKEIIDSLKRITNFENEIKNKEQRISELKIEIESLEKKIISLRNYIEKIKSSKEYHEYLKLKQSLKKLNSEKPQIKNQIDSQFTKISRPLGRYEYISSDKEQKNLLIKLVEDPIEVLVTKNKDLIIIILENVRKGILSGSISVKDVEKSMFLITETIESLDSFIKQIDDYGRKIKNIENQINKFDRSELLKFEQDLEKILHEKEDYGQKIIAFESDITQIHSKIPEFLMDAESKLRQFSNIQYTVEK